jgi:hypothetical protein
MEMGESPLIKALFDCARAIDRGAPVSPPRPEPVGAGASAQAAVKPG